MSHEEFIEKKNLIVINLIVKLMGLSYENAVKIWYNSKTKLVTLDSDDLYYISPACCVDQLQYELSNDERWMTQTFE